MESIKCIKTRRSIRKYKEQPIDRGTMKKIGEATAYAPSWKNTQIASYIIIENRDLLDKIAEEATIGFVPNMKVIKRAQALAIQIIKNGVSGFEKDGSFSTSKRDGWEMYDAGISAQTFCLAAHEYGVGTVILGLFSEEKIRELVNIPEGSTPSALICMGYRGEEKEAPRRKTVDEIMTFI